MRISTLYSVKIKMRNRVFQDSVNVYRNAVDYLISVCLKHWNELSVIPGMRRRKSVVEHLVHHTAANPDPAYPDFDQKFYKLPVYLLRSAIAEALGKVSSYRSNYKSWQNSDPSSRGEAPSVPEAGYIYPCLYRGNMYKRPGSYEAQIKVYVRNTWDWITVHLRKSDVDYIKHHCSDRKECAPVLQKRGKQWYLDFCYQEEVTLRNKDIKHQTVVAVDLGISSACTCSVMSSDGTVAGRHFYKLPAEYDSLKRRTDHIRMAQRHGSRNVHTLWKLACNMNHMISVRTAQFIIDTAVKYDADCIMFEHLDTSGKKHGSKKMRLALWRKQEVQRIVTDKAHRLGMHISRINAWNTSRLAYDGSGRVLRGRESDRTGGSYSVCEFSTGKVYNCDLNASCNIGARYFIREIIKSLPATEEQRILAEVPECVKRSTCTLSTLINLNSALRGSVPCTGTV